MEGRRDCGYNHPLTSLFTEEGGRAGAGGVRGQQKVQLHFLTSQVGGQGLLLMVEGGWSWGGSHPHPRAMVGTCPSHVLEMPGREGSGNLTSGYFLSRDLFFAEW